MPGENLLGRFALESKRPFPIPQSICSATAAIVPGEKAFHRENALLATAPGSQSRYCRSALCRAKAVAGRKGQQNEHAIDAASLEEGLRRSKTAGKLSEGPRGYTNVWYMIRRRAADAGLWRKSGAIPSVQPITRLPLKGQQSRAPVAAWCGDVDGLHRAREITVGSSIRRPGSCCILARLRNGIGERKFDLRPLSCGPVQRVFERIRVFPRPAAALSLNGCIEILRKGLCGLRDQATIVEVGRRTAKLLRHLQIRGASPSGNEWRRESSNG